MVNRRQFLSLSAAGLAFPVYSNFGRSWQIVKDKDIVLTEEALRIHRAAIVVNGHNDLPYKIRLKGPSAFETLDLIAYQPEFQTYIPRLLKGSIGSQLFPYITQLLLNRGYNEEGIHKILGGNFIRVFQKAEEKAVNLK